MPEIGEIKAGKYIGYSPFSDNRYIWLACIDCGKKRWVGYSSLKRSNYHGRCKSCDAKAIPRPSQYRGRHLSTEGYIMVQLPPSDFFYPMTEKTGYIKEHRLIMARHLKRCLMPFEVVHHKEKPINDNRISNLSLETAGSHVAYHNSHGAYRGR